MEIGEVPNPLSSSEETAMPEGRPHLLNKYATSLVSIAHKTYRRIEELNGYVGSLARLVAFMAGPIVRPMEHRWLSWLSFGDSMILTVERKLMSIFPSIEPMFTKLDELAPLADSLPEKFDNAIDDLPKLVDRLPLVQLSSSLKNLANIIMVWSSSNEKETMVDEQPERDEEQDRKQRSTTEGMMHDHDYEWRAKEENEREAERRVEKGDGDGDGDGKEQSGAQDGGGKGEAGEGREGTGGGWDDGGEIAGAEPQKESTDAMTTNPIIELFDEGWQLRHL